MNGVNLTFNILALTLCMLSIVFGAMLIWSPSRWLTASLVFQACQVPRFASGVFQLAILVGIEVTLRFQGPLASLWTANGVSLIAGTRFPGGGTSVGINLVAAAIAVTLKFLGVANARERIEKRRPGENSLPGGE